MRFGTLFISSLVSTAIAVAAVPATAPAAQGCAIGKPTAASYSWDFKGEANAIFKEVALETRQAMDQADRLMSLEVDPNVSRETHAAQLNDLKDEINDIGAKLCRLETIRRMVSPWQQRVIDQVATTSRLMVDNAQDAIALCNDNPEELKFPTYWHYTNNLYNESRTLTRSIENAVKFARVAKEYRSLGHELGARNPS
jgi:hypothetical protein